jgi:hypothetical protein
MNLNFALSEEAAHLMTNAPVVNRSIAPEPVAIRTPSANREIKSYTPPTSLHREDEQEHQPETATGEVMTCMKNACKGAVYDASHWDELPGKSNYEKATVVMCRSGRFPYLLLTFAIGFFAFFIVYRTVSACVKPSSPAVRYGSPAMMRYPNMVPPQNVMVGPPIL